MIKTAQPDIIHGYLYVANIVALLGSMFSCARPAVIFGIRSSHNHLEHYDIFSRFSFWLELFSARFCGLLIANSLSGARYLIDHGVDEKKVKVVPNGIDTNRFCPDENKRAITRSEWGIANEEIAIGLVARFDPKKNHKVFIQAVRDLNHINNLKFVIVGSEINTEYAYELQRLANELGIDDKIVWAGRRSDIEAVFNGLDINVLCSNSAEGFPNVVGEAMACGTPCVVTNTGAAEEIVGDCGEVIGEPLPSALAAGVSKMLARLSPELRKRSRRRICDNYTVELLAERTTSVIRESFPGVFNK